MKNVPPREILPTAQLRFNLGAAAEDPATEEGVR